MSCVPHLTHHSSTDGQRSPAGHGREWSTESDKTGSSHVSCVVYMCVVNSWEVAMCSKATILKA